MPRAGTASRLRILVPPWCVSWALLVVVPCSSLVAEETADHPVTEPKPARTHSNAAVDALARIGQTVQAGGIETQRDFARVALEEMITAFENEAAQALAPAPAPPKHSRRARSAPTKDPAETAHWAARTSAYAEYLTHLLKQLDEADDVRVLAEGTRQLRLLIGTTTVVVSGPRIDEPQSLAAPIVQRACLELSICDVQEGEVTEETFPMSAGEWSFTQDKGAVLQIKPGLRFIFPNAERLQDRQNHCLFWARALKSLARELKDRWLFDPHMELDGLAVLEGGARDNLEIYLGAESGALPVASSVLQDQSELLHEALPWLRGQISDVYVEVDLHPPASW